MLSEQAVEFPSEGERNGGRVDRAVAVNVCNALMCLCTVVLIVAFRVG
jgi:hypothetical protein